jgi:hypothetical protein
MKPYRFVVLGLPLLLVLLRMPVACAAPENIGGTCGTTDDCFDNMNRQPIGSICKESMSKCECPLGQSVCCETAVSPGYCGAFCPFDCANPDAGAPDASAPDASVDSGVECADDSDCPERAPSPECGRSICVNGACELVIEVGPLQSQRYGDCQRRECDERGIVVIVEDTSDVYNDGLECSFDYCEGSQPVNKLAPDGFTCPQADEGYCYKGACAHCIAIIPVASCQEAGLVCDGFYCESFALCNNGACGGECAPCGVGSPCSLGADCVSKSCMGGACALPSCSDGVKNGGETGIDCGVDACSPCPDGGGCQMPADCISGVCKAGECEAPSCFDQVLNGGEEQTDCGGPCDPCP